MLKKGLVLALAATFAATPALARPWHKHRGHRAKVHVHQHRIDEEALLWLGLAALGVGSLYALSQAPRAEPAGWRVAPPPRDRYLPRGRDPWGDPALSSRERFDEDAEYCREFHQDVRIGRRGERAWGTACLQEDGSWRITR